MRLIHFAAALALSAASLAQSLDPRIEAGMKWRMIGPYRGGRTVAAVGVPSQPNVFYIGATDGGVWKSDDFGRTWQPIFDDQPTGSIGALAVAPSDPETIYAGSGEGLQRPDLSVGNGIYKSADGGKSWIHLGLEDAQQVGGIAVDPKNADRVFVAVLGHPYGPNEQRGVFRSLDGGHSWKRVLFKDADTGAEQVTLDPKDPRTVYADLWAFRQAPWENGDWQGPNSGLYKSTDGGDTWQPLTRGLPGPSDGLGRIGFCVAPSDPSRMYATVDAPKLGGIYESTDAGESWSRINSEGRLWGRGFDFAEIECDPSDENVVYVANTSAYRSLDGGHSFTALKGEPGGDDYHRFWINPSLPQIILLAGDQGACISVNAGRTWSSWYNQPTAQFYHVVTDDQFPYNVYGGQQESGSAGVSSRGADGEITFRDWHPVGADEYAYIAPDPLHPNWIYGGTVSRYDKLTHETRDVGPEAIHAGAFRFLRTMPLVFSKADPRTLFLASNVVFRTRDDAETWQIISPDLTRPAAPPPAGSVFQTPERRGVIYALGPSPHDANVLWAGTDDGLVQMTRDGGKTWQDVTPRALTPWSKVSQIDAGHFDAGTAYVSVNRMKLDDWRPHIYRTHDWGRTWTEIDEGLDPTQPVNTVREDPDRRGMLFAGTETRVSVSLDDGDHWSPLRLNMPATSIRDLVVHGDDLVVGTHGRSFWILDDITPLRQTTGVLAERLIPPELATRARWNTNTDTPLPPEEPAGKNPPDGAILDYELAAPASHVSIEVLDSSGALVRRYSSDDPVRAVDPKNLTISPDWLRPEQRVSTEPGAHRLLWDMRYPALTPSGSFYPMAAVIHDTPASTDGPWAAPGEYRVRLSVDGRTSEQPLRLRMDPRVRTSAAGIARQSAIGLDCYRTIARCSAALAKIAAARGTTGPAIPRRRRRAGGGAATSGDIFAQLSDAQGELSRIMDQVEGADETPSRQIEQSYAAAKKRAEELLAKA